MRKKQSSPPGVEGPLKGVLHGGNTISVKIVARDEAGAFLLDFFNCCYILFEIGVPD